ncbi:MAG TPA: M48 family metallopeptidase [Kiritimatiellia bacterium]|nr:M48 family metallopeptidase [Kiritimatiellia bacterium]
MRSDEFHVTSFKLVGAVLLMALAVGCSTVTQLGTSIGVATGKMTPEQAESINKSAAAVEKTFQDITPEQEYYIGRAVAATVLGAYKPFDKDTANAYLNELGQTLAMASDKPETFGGYHFLVLDTDEINAFAAPGGLILVSRGMIRCCKSEDALAAVLAHEIGHVQNEHGLRAIKKGRLTSALTVLAMESAKNLAGNDLAEVTKAFEGSISDITGTMMNSGYARNLERDADAAAVTIMKRVGYNPEALVEMLEEMQKNWKPDGPGFAKTHPTPESRIADIKKMITNAAPVAKPAERQKRFASAAGSL